MSGQPNVRDRFPNMIAVADEFKAVFGDEVKLVYVREGDDSMGKADKEQGKWVTPYVPNKVEAKHGR